MAQINEKQRIRQTSRRMIERNANLRKAQYAYERMARLNYKLPDPIRDWEWIRPIVSTAPYDALRGVTRALSNLDERVSIHPACVLKALGKEATEDSQAARKLANEWEKILEWQSRRASKRRQAFRSSVIYSAALYHEVVGRLIHVPTQLEITGASEARRKAALRFGDWAVQLVDPKSVSIEYSEYMPERVVSAQIRTAQELVDFWGDRARVIRSKIVEDPEHASMEYVEFDYTDINNRMVWAVEGSSETAVEQEGHMLLEPSPWHTDLDGNPVPFIPWIAVAGGIDVDIDPEHQRKPLLYPVHRAEQWAINNIFGTILMSKALAEAGAPRDVIQGPGSEEVEIDYDGPAGRVNLTQFQTYQRIKNLDLDPSLREAFDRIEGAIQRATVADVLVTGQPVSGEQAYASFQLQVQTAIASLGDFRELGQSFYEQMYEKMLLTSHYLGKDIMGYGDDASAYVIDSENINPQALYIDVELTPDVPIDRMQRINAAIQLASSDLAYSPKRAMEMLGETDPEGAFEEWKLWQLDLADFRGRLQAIQMEASGELEQLIAQAAQQIVAQEVAQIQELGRRARQNPEDMGAFGEMANAPNMMRPRGGVPGAEGQGFNTGMGGEPAITADTGATREARRAVSGLGPVGRVSENG